MSGKKLEWGQIRLRALEPEDIDLLYEWENDTSIWEVSNTFEPFSKYMLAKYIKESHRDIYEAKEVRMIIETIEGTAVGAIDLFDFDPFHLRAGVGILIFDDKNRRMGYATDALQLLCNYAADYLHLHQLYANITDDNLASIQLFTKTGFKLCGTKTDWRRSGDLWKTELMFQKIF